MQLSKGLPAIILAAVFAVPGLTQAPPQGGSPQNAPPQGGSSSKTKLDFHPAFDAMDTNHDGRISKEEWLAAGMSQFSLAHLFPMLDKNNHGFLTYEEFAQEPMFEIDFNKDGKITLEEYRKANNDAGKKVEQSMKNGSGGPGGASPAGGPPAGGPGGAPPAGGPPQQ